MPNAACSALASADDRSLVLRNQDGRWYQCRLPNLDLPREQVLLLIELLTGEQLDQGTQRIIDLPKDTFLRTPSSYLDAWRCWRDSERDPRRSAVREFLSGASAEITTQKAVP